MSDAFEDRARELAHSLPLCDFGSSQAILAMAQAFRDDDARIRALEAEVARKDAALRPFAEEADDWSIAVHNRARIVLRETGERRPGHTRLNLGHFRAAADALKDPSHG